MHWDSIQLLWLQGWAKWGRFGPSGGPVSHWDSIKLLKDGPRGAGSGRVGPGPSGEWGRVRPSRAQWGRVGSGHALVALRLGPGYKDGPRGAGCRAE